MESIRNNLPIFSAVLIIVSLVRLIFYYSSFGIDIVSYIDLTEAVILSVPFFINNTLLQGIALIVAPVIIVAIILLFYIKDKLANFINPKIIKSDLKGKEGVEVVINENETTWQYLKRNSFNILLVMYNIGLLITNIYIGNLDNTINSLAYFVFTLLILLPVNKILHWLSTKFSIAFNVLKLIHFSLFLLILAITDAKFDAISVKRIDTKLEHRNQVYVELGNKKLVTGKKYRYIGKTKNYIFFYDIPNRRAEAYPLDDAQGLSIIVPKLFNYFN